jgi:hypothetical protein
VASRRTFLATSVLASVCLATSDAFAHAVRPDRGAFRNGVEHTFASFDQILPLVGLALVLGRGAPRRAWVGVGAVLVGLALGLTIPDFAPTLALDALAPSALVAVGAALPAPPTRPRAAPIAGAWLGWLPGLALAVDGPDGLSWTGFAAAVLATDGLAFGIPFALVMRFARPWFRIPSRILGSWLLTIGVLLYGLRLRG